MRPWYLTIVAIICFGLAVICHRHTSGFSCHLGYTIAMFSIGLAALLASVMIFLYQSR